MQLDFSNYPDITITELKELLDKGNSNVFLLDVREPFERAMFNIGGVLIPINALPQNIDKLPKDKSIHIVVYCRSGMRSDTAKKYLITQGYNNVQNLLGGMLAWQANS